MTKPLIQIALDSTDLDTAVSIANNVESFVDVIEVGTILAFAEGMKLYELFALATQIILLSVT